MIQGRIFAPPSPPSSPRMSGQEYKPVIPSWQDQQETHSSFGQSYPESGHFQPPNAQAQPDQRFNAQSGSSLRSYRTSPYPLSSQYHSHGISGSSYPQQGPEQSATSHPNPASQAYNASITHSPNSKNSPKSEAIEDHEDDAEEDDQDAVGEAEDDEGKSVNLSAAELRNQKRKMKRFRLTHNQTRFLMSEFARQAHPDAAHRERLSREIPGLSPRQVQVWFQNRRAKLKRLNVEDRERMMRSRALPENFDMTPSLHGTFTGPVSTGATPGASPASFGAAGLHQSGHMRPLTLDTLRRSDAYGSPTALNPSLSSIAFTPPRSATDTMSPISGPDMTAFSFAQRPVMDSPRGMYRPNYQPTGFQPPRPLAGHDRFRRTSGETASSPLRSSLSYDNMNGQNAQPQDQRTPVMQSTESQSYLSQQEGQRSMPPPHGPYGLGVSYLNYPPNVRPPQPPGTAPPSMEMMQSYQRDMSGQPHSYPEYQTFQDSTPYSSPQVGQYGQYAGQYGHQSATYSTPYMQRPDQQSQQQLPRPHFGEHASGEAENDNNNAGAPITTTY
ncbi:hypothetical protein AAFC00_001526 [Neodothiora populina]|uniref:Homeobox domain-containing protein n=1 Tax=Neodothiora populina TaxID=2781224 RepID=A0ABR3PP79_9PEZI